MIALPSFRIKWCQKPDSVAWRTPKALSNYSSIQSWHLSVIPALNSIRRQDCFLLISRSEHCPSSISIFKDLDFPVASFISLCDSNILIYHLEIPHIRINLWYTLAVLKIPGTYRLPLASPPFQSLSAIHVFSANFSTLFRAQFQQLSVGNIFFHPMLQTNISKLLRSNTFLLHTPARPHKTILLIGRTLTPLCNFLLQPVSLRF